MQIGDHEVSQGKLQIQLFGAFAVRVNGAPISPLRSRKVQWLLALLTLRHGQALDRAWLSGILWPDSEARQALYNLRQSLSNLRHALGEAGQCLHAAMVNAISLDIDHVQVDLLAFDAAIAAGDSPALERAVSLYRGPLLEGCAEEWVFEERRIREENYLNALESLADKAMAQGQESVAISYLRAAIQVDPFRERAQRLLIHALARIGEYAMAVQTYRELRVLLRRELNTDPDPETLALFQQVREQARRGMESRPVSPAPTHRATTQGLPCPLTSLVGRKSNTEQAVTSLSAARLLTLTGPGGVGKTRLAIAIASQVEAEYTDGVFFVDLAPLSDAVLIAQTIATVLQIREEPERSLLSTLQDYLQSRSLLLLLDNCEHLLDACATLTEALLRTCPGVRVLATSRQSLGLTGEVVWTVPPLSTPRLSHLAHKTRHSQKEWLSLLREYEAVELFVIRAQQALPSFQMTPQNAEAVARICTHLDGIPLALELAAARVRSLSVEEIHSKLDHRFRLLTGGSRAALPRQKTLRALMDWSYDLLNDSEKALLRRLSVFAGGWTIEAAEQICIDESPGVEETLLSWEILDVLTSLADKSLLMVGAQVGTSRYHLLETVRQYSYDRLMEHGEADTWRGLHRDYFLRLAKEAEAKINGPEQGAWLERLETEHDNLRAALDFCLVAPEGVEKGLQLAGALQQFWWTHAHLSEGRARLEVLLIQPGAQEPTYTRARALNGAASLAMMQGDFAAARPLYLEGLALGQELGEKHIVASALTNLGNLASQQGDYAAARSYYEQSLTIKRELGNKQGIASTLIGLGILALELGNHAEARDLSVESLALGRELEDRRSIARSLVTLGNVATYQGDYAAARVHYESSLAIQRELEDRRGIARCLSNLGNAAMEQGDYAVARSLFEESVEMQRELGDNLGLAHSLCNLGSVLSKQDDFSAADTCLRECLLISRGLGQNWITAYALEGCAELAHRQQQRERSARLYGAACRQREITGSPLPPSQQEHQECALAALKEEMGEAGFLMTWAEGKGMTLEKVLTYAS